MEKFRTIPQDYMTVGEIAKKMGVTVRTLQYYDKEGLLSPTAASEGGRRLYTDKDVIRLYQPLSMKSLGFSLDDIKHRLFSLDTPADVAAALAGQAADMQMKLANLATSLKEIELLREEVLQIQSVNLKKYSDILINLQIKNAFYWLIKHFDDQTLDYLRTRFDKKSGMAFMDCFNRLSNGVLALHENHVPTDSEPAQAIAKKFWDMIMEFTNGDMHMLPQLMAMGQIEDAEHEWAQTQGLVNAFIGQALDVYFTNLGVNPFAEGMQ